MLKLIYNEAINYFFGIHCSLSCRPSNNCDVIKIDEKVDSLQHSFTSPIENPFKMESEVRWKFNDTVIINNIYYGPMDTMFTSPASDFYNEKSGINFLIRGTRRVK